MLRRTLWFAAMALFLGAQAGMAQDTGTGNIADPDNPNTRVGTRGATFLEIGIGARAQAMAGAGAALQGGTFAMYWNPAGIGEISSFTVGFAYTALYDELDVDYFYFGGALNFLGGVVGVNFANLNSGEIERTTEQFPDGGDPIFGSVFDWNSSFFGAYYARQITDRLVVGAGLKFIQEGITDAQAEWVAFDAGVTFRTGLLGIELGATAQNLGGESSFSGAAVERILDSDDQIFGQVGRDLETEFNTRDLSLPTLFRFNVLVDVMGSAESWVQTSTQDHGLDIAVDLTDAVDTDIQTALGLEYNFRQIAFLRTGKRWFNEEQRTGDIEAQLGLDADDPAFFRQDDFRDFWDGFAFGGGLRFGILGQHATFDYAYVDRGELENVQVFSFELGGI